MVHRGVLHASVDPGQMDPSSVSGARRSSRRHERHRTPHGFSGSPDPDEDVDQIGAAAAEWVHAAVGPDAGVTLARPDAAGRLRVVWRDGEYPEDRRRRSAMRRNAYTTLRPVRGPFSVGGSVVMLPLSNRGEPLGVLEILSSEQGIDAVWGLLEAGANQIGVALHAVLQRAHLQNVVGTLEHASDLGAALVRAGTPEAAVRIAVRFVWERFAVPVAGWCGEDLHLVSARGIPPAKLRELRQTMPTLPLGEWLRLTDRDDILRRFGDLAGVADVAVLDAGAGVILSGRTKEAIEPSIQGVGSLVSDVLRLLDSSRVAEHRTKRIDMGIAWTAHELRRPLLGIKSVIELLLRRDVEHGERGVLRASLRELQRLSGTTEAILAWSTGVRPLQPRRVDLVGIVEEAVESCRLEGWGSDIVVLSPPEAVGLLDPPHIRTLVMNLLRNALDHATRGTKVEVEIADEGGQLRLSVTDQGPTIPAEERFAIFDPFVRGGESGRVRDGSGLGLFIARQVVEAHDGRIWVESGSEHTTFHLSLPGGGRRRRRSAS